MRTDDDINWVPKKLYKYKSLNRSTIEYTERIITHNEIYMASATSFNDPFDTLPNVSVESTKQQRLDYYKRMILETMPDLPRSDRRRAIGAISKLSDRELTEILRNVIAENANSIGICSLSARCDDVLMWSHYANNHTGICLRFKTDPPISMFGLAYEVTYSTVRPTINRIANPDPEMLVKSLLTKAAFWSYEEEWRMIDPKVGPGVRIFPPDRLDGIILGAKISSEDQRLVLDWCENTKSKVEILRATPSHDTFRIDVRPETSN